MTQRRHPATLNAGLRVCAKQTSCAIALSVAFIGTAQAQTPPSQAEPLAPVQTRWRATAETLTLPGDEKMGLLGGNLLLPRLSRSSVAWMNLLLGAKQ